MIAAIAREIQRLKDTRGLSNKEALKNIKDRLNKNEGDSVPSLNTRYVTRLSEILAHSIKVKNHNLSEEQDLKESYPKTYMLMRAQRLLKEKDGLSDFEIHIGISELLIDDACLHIDQPLNRFYTPRLYNLEQL